MKIIRLISLFLVLHILVVSTAFATEWKTYNDPEQRFSIKIPAHWEYVNDATIFPQCLMFAASDADFFAIQAVNVESVYANRTFADFSQKEMEYFLIGFTQGAANDPNFIYLGHDKITLKNNYFIHFLYQDTDTTPSMFNESYCLIANGVMYQFIYGFPTHKLADSRYILAEVLSSLTFNK